MIVVGLTGSIAMGKSEVARVFIEGGYPVFDSDKAVHALYDSPRGVALLKPLVPDAILDNRVDRQALSKRVLVDPVILDTLEKVVHAEVAAQRETFLHAARQSDHPFAVIDVPLLFEKNIDTLCDVVILVSAPPALQRQRALARPGMTEEKLARILARQMPDAEKRKHADIIIENDGSLEELRAKVRKLIPEFLSTDA